MSHDRLVIVGAGQAGFEVATRLRANGFQGSVTLVGDEREIPYQRPPLSKAYLTENDDESLALRPEAYYADHGIDLRCGRAVVTIDRSDRRVELAGGEVLGYHHLVLATGARNRPLPVPGTKNAGVHHLRTVDDARGLLDALNRCESLAVVGAGFIGLEVAAAARKRGITVTVFEAFDRVMARAVSTPMSEYFAAEHARHGVDIRMNATVEEILGVDGRVTGVRTSDGQVTPADVVVIGIGVIPNSDLAARAGLPAANGIVVDHHLRTPDPHIWAVGDCAVFPCRDAGEQVRLESVQNAVDQARCVAAQIMGAEARYAQIPWFWSEQFESKLQIAGLMRDYTSYVTRGSIADRSFSIFCFRSDRLVAVESVNAARDHLAARKILASDMPLTPEQAADDDIDLKAAVKHHQATRTPAGICSAPSIG
ncbi:NAD(P)/FAD-dependent oxidoreductase [Mycolicibacterium stellerae]|uniref:NAD(P)/FAD-dependent oxidoreductase n=1 Tax=Mycolicibacterium stellerae TaxID=2358193 RepID=UPI000F0BDAAC|nr:FAD-dependent oxidoreductase [Mycolicibacterium stellerae]